MQGGWSSRCPGTIDGVVEIEQKQQNAKNQAGATDAMLHKLPEIHFWYVEPRFIAALPFSAGNMDCAAPNPACAELRANPDH